MNKGFLVIGSILSAVSILLGAFGAHGLKPLVTTDVLQYFHTGVQYQMYHSFALLLAGILYEKFCVRFVKLAGIFFMIGIFLFSGSLYLITIMKANAIMIPPYIGIITPFGGIAFVVGWILLFYAIRKSKLER